jgi:hypothetical protein
VWNAQRMVQKRLLATPVWITFFLGWRGGSYTPPTAEAMLFNHTRDLTKLWLTSAVRLIGPPS